MTSLLDSDKQAKALPKFPRLIFLDTNIVQNLQVFGELIYDRSLSPNVEKKLMSRGPMFPEDIYALGDFMSLGLRIGWPMAVSLRTLDELEATPQPSKRSELVAWGGKLAHYYLTLSSERQIQSRIESGEHGASERFTVTQRDYLAKLLEDFPQEADRQLIIDALEFECDIFLTMDYKTVWRRRDSADKFGIKFMRPVELLEYVLPWAGLLR